MKRNLIETQVLEPKRVEETNETNHPVRVARDSRPRTIEKRTILLISKDIQLHKSLRCLANTIGRMVVRIGGMPGITSILRIVKPKAVLLDLDLPEQAAWKVADTLLSEQNCPPVILLTGQSERFDVRTAIRAGSLVDKSEDPARLLEVVEETLAMPESTQTERNAIQRILIRWLKPCDWYIPFTPAYRFWGINE
jgi:FixJ family two-component response regulator